MDLEKELKKYEDMECFNKNQMEEIHFGLKNNLDVSQYSNPEFDWKQMSEIRNGLKHNLDVSIYADPKFDVNKMNQIYDQLLNEKQEQKPLVHQWTNKKPLKQ